MTPEWPAESVPTPPSRRPAASNPPPPDDALLEIVERFTFVAVGITERVLAETTGATELTLPQWRVLTLLGAAAPLRLGDVAAAVGLSAPSASRMVSRLAGRGLISTAIDLEDRRALRIRLTPRGRALVRRIVATRRDRLAGALGTVQLPHELTPQLVDLVAALSTVEGGPRWQRLPSADATENGPPD